MKFNSVLLSVALTLPTYAVATPGVFKVDFNVHRGSSIDSAELGASAQLSKREADGVVTMQIVNENTFYMANLSVGSNSQNVGVLVDTGSSDLWIMGSDNSFCARGTAKRDLKQANPADRQKRDTGNAIDCSTYGTFDKSASTSFQSNNTKFAIQYADNTFATGGWGYDKVVIGSLTVDNLSFAVADLSNSTMGVLGIGLAGLETTYSSATTGSKPYMYENLPMKMKSDGLIEKNIYSLYLNQGIATYGSVLFGGVDHSKYVGNLVTVPIVNSLAKYYANPLKTEITLDSVSYEGNNLMSTSTIALLDSGSTLSYLPSSVVSAAVSALGLSYNSRVQAYTGSCSSFNNKSFTFTFSGATITVPASNFLMSLVLSNGQSSNTCAFGMIESSQTVLGDSFLRAAYVVYDLDDYEISLANANFGESANSENVVAVVSTIPDASSGASTGTSNTAAATGAGSASTTRRSSSSSTKAPSLSKSGAGHIANPGVLAIMGSVFGSALLLIL
ncbi:hypothetical protein BABINDRAFT_162222 [Babjeviella inositovora NRRL Y-12698]|uniref:candidapepsin n=1 Tax=Babjeviella inositovora NRRL Y-12698 TaxID=984486 RepID=A0A1E3QNB5_9ASCO|nr:uncharacterized protein BABINDRAFT_162222 [Babjeviella inositovora NRRL Y-12698]ODQ79173.1 hypothetical protein BABINDRAFT_162222 [Babjeviella inositovora NRRL Y-12698]